MTQTKKNKHFYVWDKVIKRIPAEDTTIKALLLKKPSDYVEIVLEVKK